MLGERRGCGGRHLCCGVLLGSGVVRAVRVSTKERLGTLRRVSAHVLYTFGVALPPRAWQSFPGESGWYSVSLQLHRFAPKVAGFDLI